MWASSAISDEDKLDRAETGRVLRRSLQFALPYRKTIWWAVALVSISSLCTVAGPVFVKTGLDHGIKKGSGTALDVAVERKHTRVIAVLAPERLAAVRALAVEFVAPGVTSPFPLPPTIGSALARSLPETHPHVAWANLSHRGFFTLELTEERVSADWYTLDGVLEDQGEITFAAGVDVQHGAPVIAPHSQ